MIMPPHHHRPRIKPLRRVVMPSHRRNLPSNWNNSQWKRRRKKRNPRCKRLTLLHHHHKETHLLPESIRMWLHRDNLPQPLRWGILHQRLGRHRARIVWLKARWRMAYLISLTRLVKIRNRWFMEVQRWLALSLRLAPTCFSVEGDLNILRFGRERETLHLLCKTKKSSS